MHLLISPKSATNTAYAAFTVCTAYSKSVALSVRVREFACAVDSRKEIYGNPERSNGRRVEIQGKCKQNNRI